MGNTILAPSSQMELSGKRLKYARIIALVLAAGLSALEASGVQFCGTNNKFYPFMRSFQIACLACVCISVLGIVLLFVESESVRNLSILPPVVFWAAIAMQGAIIPKTCSNMGQQMPGWDDGGGWCLVIGCDIPVFLSYNLAILTTMCILIRHLLRGSPIREIGKVVWGVIVAIAILALVVLYLVALVLYLR